MKATHVGSCQICGSFQAVHPKKGTLAKHGYTTKWSGFFMGTCPGSDEKPIEVSCDLIETYMNREKANAAALRLEVATLTSDFTGTEAWVERHTPARFGPNGRRIRSYNTWVRVTVNVTPHVLDGGTSYESYSYQMSDDKGVTKQEDIPVYGMYGADRNLASVIKMLNARRAFALQKEISTRDMYVQWQSERLASWAPQPLKERAA